MVRAILLWGASENMACRLRRCNFLSFLSSLFEWNLCVEYILSLVLTLFYLLNKVKIEAQSTRTLKHKPSSLSDMYLHIDIGLYVFICFLTVQLLRMIDQHFFYPHIAQLNDPSVYFLNCAAVEISTLLILIPL